MIESRMPWKDALPKKQSAFGRSGGIFSLDRLFHRRRFANYPESLPVTTSIPGFLSDRDLPKSGTFSVDSVLLKERGRLIFWSLW